MKRLVCVTLLVLVMNTWTTRILIPLYTVKSTGSRCPSAKYHSEKKPHQSHVRAPSKVN